MLNAHLCGALYLCGPLYLHGPFYPHGALSLLCGYFTPISGLSLSYVAISPPSRGVPGGLRRLCSGSGSSRNEYYLGGTAAVESTVQCQLQLYF